MGGGANFRLCYARNVVNFCIQWNPMVVAQPAKPISSPLAVTLTRLVALLEEDETDEYGQLQPTQSAFKRVMQLVVEAYDAIGDRFQKASVSTDDQGGIRMTWSKPDADCEVRLICPAQADQPAYIYHELASDYAVEQNVSGAVLAEWLEWLNRA
jgi:hypothetical protein